MREDRLLDRLRKIEEGTSRGDGENQVRTVNSITSYISSLLNTRQGSVPIALDFGLPDITSLATRFFTEADNTIEDLEEAIAKTIEKYEPRLKSVKVKYVQNDDTNLLMNFEINALLITEHGDVPLIISTLMTPEGESTVSA